MKWLHAMRSGCLVLGVLLLGACATRPPPVPLQPLLADELFAPTTLKISHDDALAISDEMRQYVRNEVLPMARGRGTVQALTDALYTRGKLHIEYDGSLTRNAREAFQARAGNCLSLVLMTAALAREAGLEVRFNDVIADEAWDRNGDLYFFIGHVNLSIGPRFANNWFSGTGEWVTIDFLPSRDVRRQRSLTIDENRVVSMFMNNRAVEAMAAGKPDDAYAWARAAVREDPRFLSAYNTLGVIYQRRGLYALSEQVFRAAMSVEPENPHVMGNLVLALQYQGRHGEAETLAAELRRLQPIPPFALFREGQQAMKEGDYRRARRLFERELERAADYHEFHFWLAIALLNLGETRSARVHLEKALENSTTRDQAALYSAKLDKIKAAQVRKTAMQ